jgi:hypothetical protein
MSSHKLRRVSYNYSRKETHVSTMMEAFSVKYFEDASQYLMNLLLQLSSLS